VHRPCYWTLPTLVMSIMKIPAKNTQCRESPAATVRSAWWSPFITFTTSITSSFIGGYRASTLKILDGGTFERAILDGIADDVVT
jgi:hypothetical protein